MGIWTFLETECKMSQAKASAKAQRPPPSFRLFQLTKEKSGKRTRSRGTKLIHVVFAYNINTAYCYLGEGEVRQHRISENTFWVCGIDHDEIMRMYSLFLFFCCFPCGSVLARRFMDYSETF